MRAAKAQSDDRGHAVRPQERDMRFAILSVLGVLGWLCVPSEAPPSAPSPQEIPMTRGPNVESIVVPLYSVGSNNKPHFGTIGGNPEIFTEIRALAKEGVVMGPGQAPPKLRILREFFAPSSQTPNVSGGLLGHYVFIVVCVRSDLKHVVGSGVK
jgi:hypothetical protein